jgi:nicotinamidase-related amidase
MGKSQYILQRNSSALLVIDIQEKILPVILEHERVVENTLKLINGFKILSVPIYFTEQYSKGLGPTESKIKSVLGNIEAIHKMTFSCSGAGDLFQDLKRKGIKQVVVCGVESHVCVLQTVLDLIAEGFQVHVVADAVSSRRKFDYEMALRRMESNGAEITLTESVLFELLNICGTEEFKSISKLVK